MTRIGYFLLTFFLVAAAAAQTPTSRSSSMLIPNMEMDHSATPSHMISGAEHPELIPDVTAYRLFFMVAGEFPNPTEKRKARQRAVLSQMGNIPDSDYQAVVKTLENFKVKFNAMMAEYNAEVDAAVNRGGILPDNAGFLKQRDQLVQSTRDQLALHLSTDSMQRFDKHVQSEKRRMKIAAKEDQ